MVPHLPGLDGARLVETPVFEQIRRQGDLTVALAGRLVVHGPEGTGKNFAVDHYLEHQTVPVVEIAPAPGIRSTEFIVDLHAALVGYRDDHEHRGRLRNEVVEFLRREPRILKITRAHNLTAENERLLTWLHENVRPAFPLIYVTRDTTTGPAGVATVAVRPLTGQTLIDALTRYHDLFTTADRALLAEIDEVLCHGRWIYWARFLQTALFLHTRLRARGRTQPPLDREFAKAVIAGLQPSKHHRST